MSQAHHPNTNPNSGPTLTLTLTLTLTPALHTLTYKLHFLTLSLIEAYPCYHPATAPNPKPDPAPKRFAANPSPNPNPDCSATAAPRGAKSAASGGPRAAQAVRTPAGLPPSSKSKSNLVLNPHATARYAYHKGLGLRL